MNAMNRIARALPILVVGALALTGCDLDLTDPNNPSEDDVLGSISGVLQVAVGLQAEYGNEQVDPVYVAALVADEVGAGGATFANIQQVDAGDPIDPGTGPSESPWAGMYDVVLVANVLLESAPGVGMGEATLSGVLALAETYKAMAFGNLLMTYERIPLDVGGGNTASEFATRQEGIDEVFSLLASARQRVQSTPPSSVFTNEVLAPGMDLGQLISAMTARYAVVFERYAEAAAAAAQVDLTRFSEFRFTAEDANPIWNLWYNGGNSTQMRPEDRFRLDAEAGDQRVGFWVDEADIAGAVVPLDDHAVFSGQAAAIPAFFPDEMRLIRAEVAARNNQLGEALTLVNAVRTPCSSPLNEPVACLPALTAGDVPTQSAMLAEILKQRQYELFTLGTAWRDLERFGEPVKYAWMNIPVTECDRNPNAPADLCSLN
jgi:hypothetical protein